MASQAKQAAYGVLGGCGAFIALILIADYALDRMYEGEIITDYAPDYQALGPGGGFLGLESIPESARDVHGQYNMDSASINGTFYIDLADTDALVIGFDEIAQIEERVKRIERFSDSSPIDTTRVFVRSRKDSYSESKVEMLLIDTQSGFVQYFNRRGYF